MEINIIDACKQKYGIKTPKSWPGTFITNLDEFKNACYSSCARFNNQQSISQVINSECGKQCEQALLEQIKLNGRNPCQNWQAPPPIHTPPRVTFAAEFENTPNNWPLEKRGEVAKIIALNKCGNDSQCIEQVELDSLAFKLAPNKSYNYNKCASTFPNIFSGNINTQKAPHYISQRPRKFQRNFINNTFFPVKEGYSKKDDLSGCGCSQTYNYWVLGISLTFFVLFVIFIIVFYMKKK